MLDDAYNACKGTYIEDTLYLPLMSFGDYYGTLIVLNVAENDYESVSLIVHHAVLAIMLLSSKKKKMAGPEAWKSKRFFDDLFNKKFTNAAAIYSAADPLGLDLLDKHYIALITFGGENDFSDGDLAVIKKRVKDDHIRNEIILREKQIVVLINHKEHGDYKKRLTKLCNYLLNDFIKNHKIEIKIGISDFFNEITKISIAYDQAHQAVTIGRKILSPCFFTFYADLGFYITLYNLPDDAAQIQSVRDKLKIIKAYDEKSKMNYFNTFVLLMENDRSADEIAQNAHVHKNTLLYRKKRIIGILGENPFIMPYKLNYHLYFTMEKLRNE
jgi:sugar diacid utilization regulator